MTIARRLLVLLAIPLVSLAGLGVFARLQLSAVEARSRFVAESRIAALATLGNLSRSVAELRVNVRSHLLATSAEGRADARRRFEEDEREVRRLLQHYADHLVLGDGDRRLLTEFGALSREYAAGAQRMMTLHDEGRSRDAVDQLNDTVGPVGLRLSEVSHEWIVHDQRAAAAAGEASIDAIERLRWRAIAAILMTFGVTGVLGVLTRRSIVRPIQALDASVNAIAAGDYAKAVPFVTASDETGNLARSIDVLKRGASLMDDQRWVKSQVSRFTRELQGAVSLAEFGQVLLSRLVPAIGDGVATFYITDAAGIGLQRAATYAVADTAAVPEHVRLSEGLLGQCARERAAATLTNVPRTYLRAVSSLGDAAPFQVAVLPVLSKEVLLGVFEVASFRAFNPREQALLDELMPVVGMSLDILQRHLRTEALLEETREQARQLEERSEALRQSQEQLEHTNFQADTALELTRAGYWHVPLDGSGWYNSSERAARIFGDIPNADHRYRVEEWAEHVREGDEEAATMTLENFHAAIEGRVPAYSAVYAYRRPLDGRIVWVRALGTVVKDASGAPTDMFGVTQDISDFKQLERELVGARQKAEEATAMKSMFLANMSHEIRTPMNAIIGLSHLALKTPLSLRQRDYVGKIHSAGTALLSVINDILDFSKIEAGRLDLESVSFGLDEVVGSVTLLTAQKAHDKGLLMHVPAEIPEHVVGDPLRLAQVLTNLVNNAVKFTERGEISVAVEALERTTEQVQLKFSVRDSGIGMTPEQAAHLFRPFTQADMSTTRQHGGTGLGLTIGRRLVELMGGRIWFDTVAGQGTTFFFTVWLGVGDPALVRKAMPERFSRLRVLIVDDSAAAREILQDLLSTLVGKVDTVSSGEAAIAAVRHSDPTEPYDIVFMDWRMDGMDGLQASRQIKNDGTLLHRPTVVLVTAFGHEEVREEAERLQLDGFLVKPVTKSTLVDTLLTVFLDRDPEAATAERVDRAPRLRGARILLAEDNAINQQIATELLEREDATVEVANTGREAVQMLAAAPAEAPFALVLMDLQMPEMDGFQATAMIRADPRWASLPIIAMTAHATIEERQRCLDAGMDDHVAKPIDPEHLIATVANYYHRTAGAAAAAPGELPHRGDVDPALPPIEGLDVAPGLSRVGGSPRVYRRLLAQFVDQHGTAAEEIAHAFEAGDVSRAERLAHSLKGVAGNIGAARLYALASQLERLIHERAERAEVSAAIKDAADALTHLRSQLQVSAQVTEPPAVIDHPHVSMAQARDTGVQLAHLLAEFDPAAAAFLEAHRTELQVLVGAERWPQFEQLVLGFAFTEAQRELTQAAAGA